MITPWGKGGPGRLTPVARASPINACSGVYYVPRLLASRLDIVNSS